MEASPTLIPNDFTLGDFLAVAETGYAELKPLSYETKITSQSEASRVLERLTRLGIDASDARWGESGLVLDFADNQDFILFTVAFEEPKITN